MSRLITVREALQCFIDNLRPIVKYAEQFGVIVAIEPVWKAHCNTVERARKRCLMLLIHLIFRLYSTRLTCYVLIILHSRMRLLRKAFELLLKDILLLFTARIILLKAVSLSQWQQVQEKGNPVTGGGLNYPLLLKKIKEHKPYVHCTLENTVPENAVATKRIYGKNICQCINNGLKKTITLDNYQRMEARMPENIEF